MYRENGCGGVSKNRTESTFGVHYQSLERGWGKWGVSKEFRKSGMCWKGKETSLEFYIKHTKGHTIIYIILYIRIIIYIVIILCIYYILYVYNCIIIYQYILCIWTFLNILYIVYPMFFCIYVYIYILYKKIWYGIYHKTR